MAERSRWASDVARTVYWSLSLPLLPTPSTKKRLEELEARREELNISILQEKLGKPKFTKEQIVGWIERFKYGDPNDLEYQKQIIDVFVNSIFVFDDKLVMTYNYKDESETISLEDVQQVFGSDIAGSAPPISTRLFKPSWRFFYPIPLPTNQRRMLKLHPALYWCLRFCQRLCHVYRSTQKTVEVSKTIGFERFPSIFFGNPKKFSEILPIFVILCYNHCTYFWYTTVLKVAFRHFTKGRNENGNHQGLYSRAGRKTAD